MMNWFICGLIILLNGIFFWRWHLKINAESCGNDSATISFFCVGVPGLAQCLLSVAMFLSGCFLNEMPLAAWWTVGGVYCLTLTPFALCVLHVIKEGLTYNWYPSDMIHHSMRCKKCGAFEDNQIFAGECRNCGHTEQQLVCRRSILDWRKPWTWLNRYEILPCNLERGYGVNGLWYGPNPPAGYKVGDWLKSEEHSFPA